MVSSKFDLFKSMEREPEALTLPDGRQMMVRPVPESIRSHRVSQMFDNNGRPLPGIAMKDRVWSIIDQIVTPDGQPMFNESDFDEIASYPGSEIDTLVDAIIAYNQRGPEKNGKGGLSDTAESSSEIIV